MPFFVFLELYKCPIRGFSTMDIYNTVIKALNIKLLRFRLRKN